MGTSFILSSEAVPLITTKRLILRAWKDEDILPYAEMNADPKVREFFSSVLTREQSESEVRRLQAMHDRDGFCLFAAELVETGEFIGFIGLMKMTFAVPSLAQPAVEIGWRLSQKHWGKGLATEGARGAVRFAFDTLNLPEIVAITVPANVRSWRVMEKIGMKRLPGLDFDHPGLPAGHPLRPHLLYALQRSSYLDRERAL